MLRVEKIYESWTGERVARHILYWLAWLLFYATLNSYHYYQGKGFATWVLVELFFMTVKLPFTYLVIYYLVPSLLIRKKYWQFILAVLLMTIIGGVSMWAVDSYIISPYLFGGKTGWTWETKIFYKGLDLIYIASLPTIFKMLQRQICKDNLNLLLSEQKLQAELKLLRNQLQPHFLFNTLNNLYGMVLTQHPSAADTVLRLADMMAYMLYQCEDRTVGLEKEIENLENYIALEKIRYGSRLTISFETSVDRHNKLVPPLLFIPFVENAFKHGVAKNEAASWVRINLWVKEGRLEFMIENSLPDKGQDTCHLPRNHSGIGLANVKKRLNFLYPGAHELEIAHQDTYLVRLTIHLNHT